MRITKKRINSVKNYLSDIRENSKFFIGVRVSHNIKEKIIDNFDGDRVNGFTPKPLVGIQSKRNTVGEFIPDKTKEKEIAYRDSYWELTDYGGNLHSGYNEIPYKRYPRIFKSPKNMYLNYTNNSKLFIVEKEFVNNSNDFGDIKFGINLLLELFGLAEIFPISGAKIKIPTEENIKKINWEIFPKGDRIWSYIEKHERTYGLSKSSHVLIRERFEFIESLKPSFKCIGKAGFTGYVVFGFENDGIYIFDSIRYGNATYIFDDDWKKLSKLTKQQIISKHYVKRRLVHNKNWKEKIKLELNE